MRLLLVKKTADKMPKSKLEHNLKSNLLNCAHYGYVLLYANV